MKTHLAYCSACDRDVRIAMTDEAIEQEGQANIHDAEIVCLEIGEKCTGHMCPVGAQPPAVMAVRLVRSGLKPVVQPVLSAQCEACDDVTKFAIINADYATCTVCGTTVKRSSLDIPTSN
jgi:hypothetical protein